jgi:hypothetical protein
MPCAKCHFEINKTMVADQGILYVYLIIDFLVKAGASEATEENDG